MKRARYSTIGNLSAQSQDSIQNFLLNRLEREGLAGVEDYLIGIKTIPIERERLPIPPIDLNTFRWAMQQAGLSMPEAIKAAVTGKRQFAARV
jgi:hypothetical protein